MRQEAAGRKHFWVQAESLAAAALLIRAGFESEALFLHAPPRKRNPLSRVTVWLMVKQVAAGAGLEALDVHPHSLIRFSWAIFARK